MDLTQLNKDRKDRRKTSSLDMGTMMFGKVQPQAKDMEQAILGAIMVDKRAFDVIIEILSPETFYLEAHQCVFRSMMSLAQKNMPIDSLTVFEELRFREEIDLVGGPGYIAKLTNGIVSAANIEAHARIILQKFIQREIIRIGGEMVSDGYEDSTDVFDLIESAEEKVFAITQNYMKKDYECIDKSLVKVIQRIEHLRTLDSSVTGVHTGYDQLDRITHGWQPTDLIIIAARPSVGKTAFALNLARNAALHPVEPTPVGFFSLEMSTGQLVQRILSAESDIFLERIKTGRLEDYQLAKLYQKGVQPLSRANIYIDDTAALNMFELRAKARRMKNKHKVGLIIIDYLQLMSGDNNRNSNREQEISKISRDLKKLAKDIEVPIIALSQLSREVEKRGKGQKVPQLSDLRESGAIEQDADIVGFLYRPAADEVAEDAELANVGMFKISKHRDGSLEDFVFEVNNNVQQWNEKGVVSKIPPNLTPVKEADKKFIQAGVKFNSEDPEDELPF